MHDINVLEARLNALEARLKVLEHIIQAPDPDPIQPEEDTNRAQARKRYEAATEEEKRIAAAIAPATVEECINACKSNFNFIGIQELYNYYSTRCRNKRITPIFQKYFILALFRDGYPPYTFYGKACIWISDQPKPGPGKRAKKRD